MRRAQSAESFQALLKTQEELKVAGTPGAKARLAAGASFGSLTPASKAWEPADARKGCWICKQNFDAFRWRHHCRTCGVLVCEGCSKLDEKLSSTRNCVKCIEAVLEARQALLIEKSLAFTDAELSKDVGDKLSVDCLEDVQRCVDEVSACLRPNNEAAFNRLRAAQDSLQIVVDTYVSSKELGQRIAHMTREALKPGDVWSRSQDQIDRTHAQLRKGVKAILERAALTPGAEEAHHDALQKLHHAVEATEAKTVRDKAEQLEIAAASEEEDLEAFARIIASTPVDLAPAQAPTVNRFRNKAVAVERLAWNIDKFDSPMIMVSSESCIESPALMAALVAVIAGTVDLEDRRVPPDKRDGGEAGHELTYNDCANRALEGVTAIAGGYRGKDSTNIPEDGERNLRTVTAKQPGLLPALVGILNTSEYGSTLTRAALCVSAIAGPTWRQPSAGLCRQAGLVEALALAEHRLSRVPGVDKGCAEAIQVALRSIKVREVAVPAGATVVTADLAPASIVASSPMVAFPGAPPACAPLVAFPGALPLASFPGAPPAAPADAPEPMMIHARSRSAGSTVSSTNSSSGRASPQQQQPLMPFVHPPSMPVYPPDFDSDEDAGLSF